MTFSPTDAAEAYKTFPNKTVQSVPKWFKPSSDPKIVRKLKKTKQVAEPSKRNKNRTVSKKVEEEEEQSWFSPTLHIDAKESATVQPKMTALINELDQSSFCNQMKDKHAEPTVGTRKPDIVHYRNGQSESVFNIICLGELKGRRSNAKFSNEEKGHILEMTQTLAELQPFRSEFTCYITDTKYIQFFKLHVQRKVCIATQGIAIAHCQEELANSSRWPGGNRCP